MDNPYASSSRPASPVPSQSPEAGDSVEFDVFKSWLIFFLLSTVCGFFIGLVAGVFLGVVMGIAGMPLEWIKIGGSVIGFLVGIPVSYFSFRYSAVRLLKKRNV